MLPEKKSQLTWDGKDQKNFGDIGTKLYGFRHFQHEIVYKKNGYKPFHQTIRIVYKRNTLESRLVN